MTDGIYNNPRRPALDGTARGSAGKTGQKAPLAGLGTDVPATEETKAKPKASGADQLHLSNVKQKLAAEPGFDRAKVEAIKQAIQDGNYPLDPQRIAESFHAIEQMISQ